MATMAKAMLGTHAASSGGKLPFVENTVEKRSEMINKDAMMMPMARCKPLPPRVFLPAMMAPMSVSNITVNGVADRR